VFRWTVATSSRAMVRSVLSPSTFAQHLHGAIIHFRGIVESNFVLSEFKLCALSCCLRAQERSAPQDSPRFVLASS
jgi:hypothetical protein